MLSYVRRSFGRGSWKCDQRIPPLTWRDRSCKYPTLAESVAGGGELSVFICTLYSAQAQIRDAKSDATTPTYLESEYSGYVHS